MYRFSYLRAYFVVSDRTEMFIFKFLMHPCWTSCMKLLFSTVYTLVSG